MLPKDRQVSRTRQGGDRAGHSAPVLKPVLRRGQAMASAVKALQTLLGGRPGAMVARLSPTASGNPSGERVQASEQEEPSEPAPQTQAQAEG